ncbi:hypothetical protein H2200_009248 [Cladophialophora chaetospira]|uniref:Uncharacterized protein n=1 Tax=Cladophialophora chaetospira TaxID=386627 RepID=A0AA38X3R4_9EURO|nr:hypothetical protein H2200_009248 [Cladophialophora chaetospira]
MAPRGFNKAAGNWWLHDEIENHVTAKLSHCQPVREEGTGRIFCNMKLPVYTVERDAANPQSESVRNVQLYDIDEDIRDTRSPRSYISSKRLQREGWTMHSWETEGEQVWNIVRCPSGKAAMLVRDMGYGVFKVKIPSRRQMDDYPDWERVSDSGEPPVLDRYGEPPVGNHTPVDPNERATLLGPLILPPLRQTRIPPPIQQHINPMDPQPRQQYSAPELIRYNMGPPPAQQSANPLPVQYYNYPEPIRPQMHSGSAQQYVNPAPAPGRELLMQEESLEEENEELLTDEDEGEDFLLQPRHYPPVYEGYIPQEVSQPVTSAPAAALPQDLMDYEYGRGGEREVEYDDDDAPYESD